MPVNKSVTVTLVVTRSFGTLNEGDRFTAPQGDQWVRRMMDAGLIKEVPSGTGADTPGEG